jgi:hypothetical protein
VFHEETWYGESEEMLTGRIKVGKLERLREKIREMTPSEQKKIKGGCHLNYQRPHREQLAAC